MLIKCILVISDIYEIFGQFVPKMGSCMALTTTKEPRTSAQLSVTLYTKKSSSLLVELNALESCSPWTKVPPIL